MFLGPNMISAKDSTYFTANDIAHICIVHKVEGENPQYYQKLIKLRQYMEYEGLKEQT